MLEAVTGAPDRAVLNLRVGGVCLMVGAVLFATVRLLHGDTPAADAEASLNFVQHRSTYAAVHVFAALIMLVTLTGLMALARSLIHPVSWLVGQSAVASALAGWALFTVETTSEGLAMHHGVLGHLPAGWPHDPSGEARVRRVAYQITDPAIRRSPPPTTASIGRVTAKIAHPRRPKPASHLGQRRSRGASVHADALAIA